MKPRSLAIFKRETETINKVKEEKIGRLSVL